MLDGAFVTEADGADAHRRMASAVDVPEQWVTEHLDPEAVARHEVAEGAHRRLAAPPLRQLDSAGHRADPMCQYGQNTQRYQSMRFPSTDCEARAARLADWRVR